MAFIKPNSLFNFLFGAKDWLFWTADSNYPDRTTYIIMYTTSWNGLAVENMIKNIVKSMRSLFEKIISLNFDLWMKDLARLFDLINGFYA